MKKVAEHSILAVFPPRAKPRLAIEVKCRGIGDAV